MKLIRFFYSYMVLILITIGALLVIAAQADVPEFGTLEEFFVWVGTGGGAMLLSGLVMAYLLENFAWWHDLPRWFKLLVPILLSALFGILGQAVITLELLTFIPPPVQMLILTMIAWLFSQLGYRGIKEGGYADSARRVDPVPTPPVPPSG